ncbi:hypothetical protein KEM54_005462 [Ascosphaera aggregata]|nr:hypothetical protein KEM54_005462 [Ascosphaera aggregata]
MPSLKQLTCNIEWANVPLPFKECGTVYGDGVVESYVAIPDSPTPFAIRLQSHGYIAPGLAMFVFIDGVYQCNRNRDNLKQPDDPDSSAKESSEVTFRVRQKEEQLPDGSWIGKPWRFEPLQIVSEGAKRLSKNCPSLDNLGTIHVFVLRCLGSNMGSDGAHTPDSGMEAFYDFEELGNEVSTLRLSALSPVQFAKPFFTSFDGPCDHSRKFMPNSRSVRRHHSHGYSAERTAKHSLPTCPVCVGHHTDSESYSESSNDSCTCACRQGYETDATSCSSIRPCIQKRAFSAYERIPANACHKHKLPRARRHTHQSHEGLPTIPMICEEKSISQKHRRELDHDDGSNLLHGRPRHFSPVRDDSSSFCTSSDEITSRRRRSRKPKPIRSASSVCSANNYHCHDKCHASAACQGPSEYIDQTGNHVVVPPIVLHVNPPQCLRNTSEQLIKASPSRKARSSSSGCYIIKNGQRIPQNKGWCPTSPDSSGEEDSQVPPEHIGHPGIHDDTCCEANAPKCSSPACRPQGEQAWLSWIKGTGIQHDGNSGSLKNVKMNKTTLFNTSAAPAQSLWGSPKLPDATIPSMNQKISAVSTQDLPQWQTVQSGAAMMNINPNEPSLNVNQAINSDWNRLSNDNSTAAARITNEWSNSQESWVNQTESSGQLQQQATPWNNPSNNGIKPTVAEKSSWGKASTIDANSRSTSWNNNTSSGPGQPAVAARGKIDEWDTKAGNGTINEGTQNDSWDVNCPGKWTEGTSEWNESGFKAQPAATQAPEQSTHGNANWRAAHPEASTGDKNANKGQFARPENSPTSKGCSPADVSSSVPPLYAVPASMAESRALSHQVQPGQESFYAHRIKKPKYIDTLDKPYAKFVFHYQVIEKKFGVHLAPTATEERMKLEKLPKAEILNRLLVAEGLVDDKVVVDSTTHPDANGYGCKVDLPSNANEGIPSSSTPVIHFGPIAAPSDTQMTAATGAPEQASWKCQKATGGQGFLQSVNNKLQTHVEYGHESRRIENEWNVASEAAPTAW